MNNCPICGEKALPERKQPQAGLHAFSTIFKCGCIIDQAFSSPDDEFSFNQKCDEEKKEDVVELALKRREKNRFRAHYDAIRKFK